MQKNLRLTLLAGLLLSTHQLFPCWPHHEPPRPPQGFRTPAQLIFIDEIKPGMRAIVYGASYAIPNANNTEVTLYSFDGDKKTTHSREKFEAYGLLDPKAPKPQPIKQIIWHQASEFNVFNTEARANAWINYYDKHDNLIARYPYDTQTEYIFTLLEKNEHGEFIQECPLDLSNLRERTEITAREEMPRPNARCPDCLLL
jgi:hypothetical protein